MGTLNFTVRPEELSRSPKIYTIGVPDGSINKEKALRGDTLSLV